MGARFVYLRTLWGQILPNCCWILVVKVWPSKYNMFCFGDVRLEQKAAFYAIFLKCRFQRADKKLIWAWNRVRLLLQYLQTLKYLLYHQQESTDLFVDFRKQKLFTYHFLEKCVLICHRNSNLSSKQSVVRRGTIQKNILKSDSFMFLQYTTANL